MRLEDVKLEVVGEYLDLGLEADAVKFNPASDCVNLVCEIIVTDAAGPKVVGHIYKSIDKSMNQTFIARYYYD